MRNVLLTASVIVLILVAIVVITAVSKKPLAKNEVHIKGQTFAVEVADTMAARSRGLSGHEPLGEREGMLFLFGTPSIYSFWMLDMKFPLDIIFIREHKIVEIAENLPAPTGMFDIASTTPVNVADSVLEVNAGTAKKLGWQVGDEVSWKLSQEK